MSRVSRHYYQSDPFCFEILFVPWFLKISQVKQLMQIFYLVWYVFLVHNSDNYKNNYKINCKFKYDGRQKIICINNVFYEKKMSLGIITVIFMRNSEKVNIIFKFSKTFQN